MVDVDFGDCLDWLATDRETSAVLRAAGEGMFAATSKRQTAGVDRGLRRATHDPPVRSRCYPWLQRGRAVRADHAVGQGGIAVEVIDDKALALPPLNLGLARELIRRTRVFRLLQGYRNRPSADLDQVALALVKIAQIAADHPEVRELDANPVLADSTGLVALDARIKLRPAEGVGEARFAIRPYPSALEEEIELGGRRRRLLRPIRPEDEPKLCEAFLRLSPDAVRMRFFAPMKELSHGLAARLTQIDYDREMALVLTEPAPAGRADIFAVVRIAGTTSERSSPSPWRRSWRGRGSA